MKKVLTFIVAILATATMANAQLGIIGGFTSSKTTLDNKFDEYLKGANMFHAGLAYKQKLMLGFAVQPQLTYEMKGAAVDAATVQAVGDAIKGIDFSSAGYLELGVGVQWGMDLLVFRPFVFAEPFIGYQITGKKDAANVVMDGVNASLNNAKNKLEYGIGLGAGVEVVKHIQVSVQWFKNLGHLYNDGKIDVQSISDAAQKAVVDQFKDAKSYSGVKVSLGIFF